jgi:predicted TIM-barrel fold metal-dependent hydrolase
MTTALLEQTTRDRIWQGTVIDADVHAVVPTFDTLFEYQSDLWIQWAKDRGYKGPKGMDIAYPPNAPTTARDEWRPESGRPASSLDLLQKHILDPWNVDYAVLTCNYGVDSLRHPDWAAALASSINDWLIDQWLDKDPRLVASIVIPSRDPAAAAREIDRVGQHPGFKQVLVPVRGERLYGQRVFHPIWEAVERNDLVLGLHWGGTVDDVPSTSGWPSWWVEEYSAEVHNYIGQLTNMIAEGVFKKFPGLRVSVLEAGFAWVPGWAWRLNKEWKGLRREIPWVDRPPLDILREHVRFSTAPIDAGPPEEMAKIVDWLGTDDILMFATDYPHRHDDDIAEFLSIIPEGMRSKVMSETARSWYRLPESTKGGN